MRSVLGREASDAVNPSSQEYEALTNGHKKYHHHHHGGHPQHDHHHHGGQHHHKHHGKHHHGKPHHGKHYHKKPHKKPHHHKPPKVEIDRLSSEDPSHHNVQCYAYLPFIKALDQIKIDMLANAEKPEALSLEAGTFKNTIIGMGRVMVNIQPLFPANSKGVSLPLIQDMRVLIPLIDAVISCAGDSGADCSGITQLMNDFNDEITMYLTELAATSGADAAAVQNVITGINSVTSIIDDVFKTREDTTLPDAGKLLNGIIGTLSGNSKIFKQASLPVNMYYEAAKEVLRCEGFDITMFAGKCSAYGDRLQGILTNVIEWIQTTLNNIPLIGPIFTTLTLEALKQVVITLQNGGGEAVGGVIGMVVGIIHMFGLVLDADNTGDPQTDAILAFLGIADVAGDCGGRKGQAHGCYRNCEDPTPDLGSTTSSVTFLLALERTALIPAHRRAITLVTTTLKGAASVINFCVLATFGDADDADTPPTQSLMSGTLTFF
ncbi:hypothetical protein KI688_008477 [Linnemannia hyalina]|uniref:Uncharacterized protein n=1 Tax=Linnemannia hyalina TaxID=64524 RepID=A0A9P7Y3P8_9FUNG|nr:hypothetical protein KI688_008477 [Linnemannia hyalina]